MKAALVHVHRVTHVATLPIQFVVRRIPHVGKRKAAKMGAGVVIMIVGVVVAKNPFHLVNHIIADLIGYGLHGYGALPFIKILCARFDLEHIDEDESAIKLTELSAQLAELRAELKRQKELKG